MTKNYYITTTLPYVNAKPHIGFALEIIQADALARYHRILGETVVFNTGTDEHGIKIFRKAQEEKKDPKAYCDEYAEKFDDLKKLLNLSYTNFIRTTDVHHEKAAQDFWMKCFEAGDIYKKDYEVNYCVGCELEKMDSELEEGKCPIHPNLELEVIEEENYFFKFSRFQQPLLDFYETHPEFVVPSHRFNEIKAFVSRGLDDFSISRLKTKMPWGVQVPNDLDHVMYVWFDALVNYISTIGWPNNSGETPPYPSRRKVGTGSQGGISDDPLRESPPLRGGRGVFHDFWPGVQVAGKDNLRQQTAMWQAMLMSAGLSNSKQVFIHGFITAGGQKMSKSLGNVVDPVEIVEKYGVDPLRYYLLGGLPSYDDGDFTIEKFEEFYTAHLVNGVGNLTSRILTMFEKYINNEQRTMNNEQYVRPLEGFEEKFWGSYDQNMSVYDFQKVVLIVNDLVKQLDTIISDEKPWEKTKNGEDIKPLLYQLAEGLRHIALALLPIIPESAHKILTSLGYSSKQIDSFDLSVEKEWGRLESGTKIVKGEILFPRLEK